jgi:hypothetical protein
MRAGSLPGPDGAFASSPLPIAPHKTRIVGDAHKAAVRTALDMAAERRGPARLDRPHDAALCSAKMTGMGLAIGLAVVEHIGHLGSVEIAI